MLRIAESSPHAHEYAHASARTRNAPRRRTRVIRPHAGVSAEGVCRHRRMYTYPHTSMCTCLHATMYTYFYVHMLLCRHATMYTCYYVDILLCRHASKNPQTQAAQGVAGFSRFSLFTKNGGKRALCTHGSKCTCF